MKAYSDFFGIAETTIPSQKMRTLFALSICTLKTWLDEPLLRRDPILRPYWRKRDVGYLDAAEAYLDQNMDAVMASVDLDNTVSEPRYT
jgi:hypothetical protein